MEWLRAIKNQIRNHPVLFNLIQPAAVKAALRLRNWRKKRWFRHYNQLVTAEAGNYLRHCIESGQPIAAGKLGTLELEILIAAERVADKQHPQLPTELKRMAYANVGVFPCENNEIAQFVMTLRQTLSDVDLLAVWGFSGEPAIVNSYCRSLAVVTSSGLFDPWIHKEPWTRALAGKKVLLIHPFVSTMTRQLPYLDKVWGDLPLMRDIGLRVIRMPLSPALLAPEESTWHERLAAIKSQMDAVDFDVALIGAGGMSLPLAVHAKSLGKIGIHMGGSTQVLFGIKGKRYDDNPALKNYFNDYWTRPGSDETPPEVKVIESGCYW